MERHRCRSCDELKDADQYWYYTDKRRAEGNVRREATCKLCRMADRRKRNSSLSGYLKRKISQLKHARRKQGVYFELSLDDVLDIYKRQFGLCALTDMPLEYGVADQNKWASNNLSIDRICEDDGYTKDNIQLVVASINFMRGSLPLDVFVGLCGRVSGRNSRR